MIQAFPDKPKAVVETGQGRMLNHPIELSRIERPIPVHERDDIALRPVTPIGATEVPVGDFDSLFEMALSRIRVPTLLVQTSSRPWMDTYSGRLLSEAASTAENQPSITPLV